MRPNTPTLCLTTTLALTACAADPGDGGIFDTNGATDGSTASSSATASGTGGNTSASGGGATDSSSGGNATTAGGSTGGIKYDVGGAGDATASGGDGTMGCEKIDFLFVVDNSGSMGAYQNRLVNSFPAFMDTIFATVQAQDYHIMVVDSDAGGDINGACEPCTPDSFWCEDWCQAKANLDVACETTLGAGEVAPYNNEASNTICGVPNGVRYLTSDLSQQEIKDKFSCMARVGTFGSGSEKPVTAAVEAVTTQGNACNQGFLRDDAVLVVTFITDDYPVENTNDDSSTFGDPQQWHDAIIAAKNNDPSHVVMLGVMNLQGSTCIQEGSAGQGPVVHPTQRFVDFVGLFGGQGITGDVCASPDYSAFFEQAVGLIDQSCDDFMPPG